MRSSINQLVGLPTDVAEPATEFRQMSELTGSMRSGMRELLHGRSWDGSVIVCLEVDNEDRAIVDVQSASGPGYDDLATVEQAIAHLEIVRDRLLAMHSGLFSHRTRSS